MKRQMQGVIVLLLAILLTLAFRFSDRKWVGDFSDLTWSTLFLLLGAGGAVWGLLPEKKK